MITRRDGLPAAFNRLWLADALSTAGDGFTMVAAPLLLTTLTTDPVLIAGGAFAAQVPWLVFGLHSGALVDRVDQRRLIMRVDIIRALLMGGLVLAIVSGSVSVALVYVLLFVSGSGDTLVVTAGTSLVPGLVSRAQLTRANARLIATRLGGGLLIARPAGAWLFTQGHAAPFVVDGTSFLAGVAVLVGLSTRPRAAQPGATRPRVREGLQILWRDEVLRILALCILVMNLTLSGTLAVLVIYSHDRLRLGATGFGLLGASIALGGLLGAAVVSRLVRRLGTGFLLKGGLVIESGTQLLLATTTSPLVAGVTLLVFGVHSSVWSVLTVSLRQHRTTDDVRGRVMAAYMVLSVGGAAAGALLGGVLVAVGGITAPMWFGAIVVGVVLVVAVVTLRSADLELDLPPPASAITRPHRPRRP